MLQEIVGHLSGDDLDSVRLVSRELSVVAAVFKYRTLRVPVSLKGLKHLLFVSQQPALAYFFREIIYPWGYLPPLEPAYGSSLAQLTQYASIFVKWYNKKLYSPQTMLENFGECVAALEAALPRMSNIRALQPCFMSQVSKMSKVHLISEDSKARGAKQILDLMDVSNRAGLKPQSLAIGSSITSEPPVLLPTFFADSSRVLRNCSPLFENLTSLSLYVLDGPHKSNYYTLVDGLEKPIKGTIIDVQDLVNVLRRHSGSLNTLSLDIFSLSGEACKDHFLPLVKNLTSLSLYLYGPCKLKDDTNFESLEEAIRGGRLHHFLSSAPKLRFLSLRINFCDLIHEEIPLSLLDIFGNTCVWKYLHTLHFGTSNTFIDVKDLADVLRRHSGTFDSLSLDLYSVSISGGTRRDIEFRQGAASLDAAAVFSKKYGL
ncbi:hypothetical protein RUND412_007543 [Rhizina undulata]